MIRFLEIDGYFDKDTKVIVAQPTIWQNYVDDAWPTAFADIHHNLENCVVVGSDSIETELNAGFHHTRGDGHRDMGGRLAAAYLHGFATGPTDWTPTNFGGAPMATTAEMQAGTETDRKGMSPSLVKDAIDALAGSGGGGGAVQLAEYHDDSTNPVNITGTGPGTGVIDWGNEQRNIGSAIVQEVGGTDFTLDQGTYLVIAQATVDVTSGSNGIAFLYADERASSGDSWLAVTASYQGQASQEIVNLNDFGHTNTTFIVQAAANGHQIRIMGGTWSAATHRFGYRSLQIIKLAGGFTPYSVEYELTSNLALTTSWQQLLMTAIKTDANITYSAGTFTLGEIGEYEVYLKGVSEKFSGTTNPVHTSMRITHDDLEGGGYAEKDRSDEDHLEFGYGNMICIATISTDEVNETVQLEAKGDTAGSYVLGNLRNTWTRVIIKRIG